MWQNSVDRTQLIFEHYSSTIWRSILLWKLNQAGHRCRNYASLAINSHFFILAHNTDYYSKQKQTKRSPKSHQTFIWSSGAYWEFTHGYVGRPNKTIQWHRTAADLIETDSTLKPSACKHLDTMHRHHLFTYWHGIWLGLSIQWIAAETLPQSWIFWWSYML